MRELGGRQNVTLNAAPRTDEKRLDRRTLANERPRNGDPRIEVTAGLRQAGRMMDTCHVE